MHVRATILAGAAGLATAGAAWGQAAPQQPAGKPSAAVRSACASDVKTLCPSAQPGSGQIRECMRENAAKLSMPCKEAVRAERAAKREGSSPPSSP